MQDESDQQKQWDKTYASANDFFGTDPSELAVSALPAFKDNKVRNILELGCGQGRDTWFFAKNGFEMTALDYSEAGICQMKEKAKGQGAKVSLKVHDARDPLPFPDDSFDAIYSHMFFTMEFTEEEVAKMLAECQRVLRPGGINIYSVRNDHDPHYGKFIAKGKDMWQNPMGFVVHFFTEEMIRRLAKGYELMWIKEFEDRSPPFVKKLYEVALRKPSEAL
ncbi:MAG: class I SAM-dependent methyltransferase [Euryarchaeota archaeon]|nr:class I SAM-dependent methyltransferase [Euryarchaeota archaeon]